MKLYDFCMSTYKNDERWQNNGLSNEPKSIILMISTIYRSLTSGLPDAQHLPELKTLLALPLSESGEFSPSNLADLVAIVFDTMTEINRNPRLWSSYADSDNQAKHTFVVLFHGANGEVIQNNQGAARGKYYQSVKSQLIKDIDASYNRPS
ncbi:hypothetical protein Q2S52_002243 [Escherichia coli]|uniref:hypothetical protein n=1 Tax=Escherichia coli TaxID=562 RepID=UPI000BE9CEC1|nr:hypothetical protein [Escherichia coli]EFB9392257.1 hypothetical protein [Escherichia coli]ELM8902303.1 hypothetical protein [Escherichia coli]